MKPWYVEALAFAPILLETVAFEGCQISPYYGTRFPSSSESSASALEAAPSASAASPSPSPTAVLSFDFTASPRLPAALSWNRSTPATYFENTGRLATAPAWTPRFDHDPLTHQLKGLLMEASSTNLLYYSETFNNGIWERLNSTVSGNSAMAPDGTDHAALIAEDASSNAHYVFQNVPYTYTAGIPVAFSIFAKAGARRYIRSSIQDGTANADLITACFDLGSGTVSSTDSGGTASGAAASVAPLGNGWYRLTLTGIPTARYANLQATFGLADTSSCPYSYSGDGSSGAYVWGSQLETGGFATSYVPTANGPATRAADSAQFDTISWYNPNAGTLFAEYVNLGGEISASYRVFGLFATTDGTFSQNEISLSDQAASNTSSVTSGGSAAFAPSGSLNPAGSVNKQAIGYEPGRFSYSVNGSAPLTGKRGTLPSAATFCSIGSQPEGYMRNRYIRKIQYYNTRLADSALQRLTQ